MQGLIFDIKRFTVHDGPGIRTTVFFKGCPLSCAWCHNPESISPKQETVTKRILFDGREIERKEIIGKFYTTGELMQEIAKDRVFYDESGGGVTFSGGEPLMQHVFLKEVMTMCRENGIHVALDTSGHASEDVFRKTAALADLLLFDIKETDESRHFHATGVSNKAIMRNLEWLSRSGIKTILRVPVIPGYTFNEAYAQSLQTMIEPIKSGTICEINLLPYHVSAAHKYDRCAYQNRMNGAKSLEKEDLHAMKAELENAGWIVKIGG